MDSSPSLINLSGPQLQQLFADLKRGQGEALASLLDVYRPYLLATAQARLESRLKPKAGASDLVQETIASALLAWSQLEEPPATADEFRAWLRRLLLEQLKALRRRYYRAQSRSIKRERPLTQGDSKALLDVLAVASVESPSAEFDRKAMSQRLGQALERLPTPYRQVIVWRSRDDWPFAQIGATLDRSEDAARMLWNRAVRLLRKELGAIRDDL